MHQLLNIAKHWAIEPDYLKLIYSQLTAMSAYDERLLKNNQTTISKQEDDSIAIIPIQGVITAQESFLSSLLGGTSLDVFMDDFQESLNDDSVKAILLNIDSPGGVAVGPQEVADRIYSARSQKPIWAYIARHGCSAAYWLAASCEKIVANRSALVGSIGVVSTVPVQENPDSEGYRHIEIVSSNAQHKRPDPRTADGMAEIRRELDSLENEFIESIAKSRHVSITTVRQDFGRGGVLVGREAEKVKMVDALGSYDEVLTHLMQATQLTKSRSTDSQVNSQSINQPQQHRSESTMNKTQTDTVQAETKNDKELVSTSPLINANYIKEQYPHVFDAIKQHGFEVGAKAERERLHSIDTATLPGYEDLASKAKANPNMTGETFALQIIALEKAKGSHFIQSAKTAESELPEITPNLEPSTDPNKVAPGAPLSEKAKAKWNSDAKIRAEFESLEVFQAYCQASESGQARILGYKEEALL